MSQAGKEERNTFNRKIQSLIFFFIYLMFEVSVRFIPDNVIFGRTDLVLRGKVGHGVVSEYLNLKAK